MYISNAEFYNLKPIKRNAATQTKVEYTHEPTNELVLERLLDGHQDVFLRANQQPICHNERPDTFKIFICDFSYRYMAAKDRELDFLLYNRMLASKQFELFVWTGHDKTPYQRCTTLKEVRRAVLAIPMERETYVKRTLQQFDNAVYLDYDTLQHYVYRCLLAKSKLENLWSLPRRFSFVCHRNALFKRSVVLSEFDLSMPGVDSCLEALLTVSSDSRRVTFTHQKQLRKVLTSPGILQSMRYVSELVITAVDSDIAIAFDDLSNLVSACSNRVCLTLYNISIEGFHSSRSGQLNCGVIDLLNVTAPKKCIQLLHSHPGVQLHDGDLCSVRSYWLLDYYATGLFLPKNENRLMLVNLFDSINKQCDQLDVSWDPLCEPSSALHLCHFDLVNHIQPAEKSAYLQRYLTQLRRLTLRKATLNTKDLLAITHDMGGLESLTLIDCPHVFCEDDWPLINAFFQRHSKIRLLAVTSAGRSSAVAYRNMPRLLSLIPHLEELYVDNLPNFCSKSGALIPKFSHPSLRVVSILHSDITVQWLSFLYCQNLNTVCVNPNTIEHNSSEIAQHFAYASSWVESPSHTLHVFGDATYASIVYGRFFYPRLLSMKSSSSGAFAVSLSQTTQKSNVIKLPARRSPTATLHEIIDVDTNEPDAQLNINQYFLGPEANSATSTRLEVKVAQSDERIDRVDEVDLRTYQKVKNARTLFDSITAQDSTIRLGVVEAFELSSEWRPLPSDTVCDRLTHIQCAVDVDVGYNPAKSLYFIRAKDQAFLPRALNVTFLIKPFLPAIQYDYYNCAPARVASKYVSAAKNLSFATSMQLVKNAAYHQLMQLSDRDKIMAVRRHIDFFKPKAATMAVNSDPDHQKLNALNKLRAGSCRHRAILGFYILQGLGVKVRRVANGVHSFCEIQQEDAWFGLDLGGAPANLVINKLSLSPSHTEGGGVVNMIASVLSLPITFPVWAIKQASKYVSISGGRQRLLSVGGTQQVQYKQRGVIFAEKPTRPSSSKPLNMEDSVPEERLLHLGYVDLPDSVTSTGSLAHYVRHNKAQKQLLIFDEASHLEDFVDVIHQQYQQAECAIYSLASLEDISLKALVVEADDYTVGDSHLLHYLKHAQAGDVLLVNWSDFRSENVGYYSMADDVRTIKRFHIPDGVRLVSVTTEASLSQYGDAFTSRFQLKVRCPRTISLSHWIESAPAVVDLEKKASQVIDLNASSFWKSLLLGRVVFEGSRVRFQEGLLAEALAKQLTEIVLVNPPSTAEFQRFFRHVKRAKCFYANGQRMTIPPTVQWLRREQSVALHCKQISIELGVKGARGSCDEVMNQDTFDQFFRQRTVDVQALHESSGLLSQHPTLRVYLDSELSVHQWAALQAELERYPQHRLHCVGHKSVFNRLPRETLIHECDANNKKRLASPQDCRHQLVKTDDVDWMASQLYQQDPKHQTILRITVATEARVLLGHTQVSYQSGRIVFSYQPGALISALEQGQSVIIAGELSPSVYGQLASLFCKIPHLWVNGQRFEPTQACKIVTKVVPYQYPPQILEKNSSLPKAWTSHRTLERAQGHLSTEQVREKCALVKRTELPETGCLSSDSDVNAVRLEKVLGVLSHQPALLMLGHTGTGKTWFFQRVLCEQSDVRGFEGLARLRHWALCRDESARYIVLHLDEVNMLPKQVLDCLMGLFSAQPHILMGSEYIELTPKHKLLGSGNPPSYGGRAMHPLWDDQVMAEVFAPLSPTFVQRHILSVQHDKEAEAVFAQVYRLLFEQGLATPRNALNMMIHLTLALEQRANADQRENTIRRCAFEEVVRITSDSSVLQETLQLLGGEPDPILESINWVELTQAMSKLSYILAREHRQALLALHQQLCRRDLALLPNSWLDGNSRAVILQGASGIGKSAMVLAYLAANGYQKMSADEHDCPTDASSYYYLSSADFHEIEAVLQRAFHDGMPVFIEEINTLPTSAERVLNTLLSGADLSGELAQNPGFMVIGTQNPSEHYAGRHEQSKAFINRCQIIDLPDYTRASLIALVQQFDFPPDTAKQLVSEYLCKRDQALANHDLVVPTPRDLFRALKDPAVRGALAHQVRRAPRYPGLFSLRIAVGLESEIFRQLSCYRAVKPFSDKT